MKSGMTRWKVEPLKWRGLPLRPVPFSPVHRQRKFCSTPGGDVQRVGACQRDASGARRHWRDVLRYAASSQGVRECGKRPPGAGPADKPARPAARRRLRTVALLPTPALRLPPTDLRSPGRHVGAQLHHNAAQRGGACKQHNGRERGGGGGWRRRGRLAGRCSSRLRACVEAASHC